MSSNLREYIEGLKQTKKTGSLKEYVLKTKASKAADEIARLGNSWLDDSNKLIDGYNARYASGSNNYRADSSEWLDGIKVSTQRLAQDADSIRSLLGKYSGYYDPKWVKSVTDMLDSNLSAQNEIYQKSLKDSEYWSKFKDEEDYKNYLSLNGKLSDVAKITLETATKASVGDEAHNFGLEVAKEQLKNNPVLMHNAVYGSQNTGADFNSPETVQKALGSSPKTAPDMFTNGFEGYTGTVKQKIPDAPLMENSMIKSNRNDLIVEKPKYEEVDVTPFYDHAYELAAARAQNRDRLKESYPGATDEELDEILNEAERRKQQRQAQSAGTGGTWFSSGGFDSDYPVLSTLRGIGGTALDIVGNMGSGIIEIGENVLDTLGVITAGAFRLVENRSDKSYADVLEESLRPGDKVLVADSEEYFRTGRLVTYEMDAEEWLAAARASEKKQKKTSDVLLDAVKTDLWDVNKPSRGVDDISFLGEKADSVAQSAGQMLATYGLAGMNIPWAATTAVQSFGSGAESALLEGAGLEGAILYGLANAATEILTEKLFKGSGLGEKGLFDTGKITKNISDKLVRSLADYGVDLMSEGAEEVVAEFANRLASKLYKEEDLITLLASDEAIEAYIDAFIGGTVISGFMNTSQNAMANASTSATYNGELGKGQTKEDKSKAQMELHQSLVTEALEIDPNNSFAKRMQAKIESGKALSGNELRLLTEGNDEALISQDQEKIKGAVRIRLEQLGETEDVNRLADIIAKVGIGENITMSERKLLANSKYGKFVSDEIGGKYDSAWVKNIELERANVGRAEEESFNNDVYALAERMAALEDEEKTPNIALSREAQAYLQRTKELLESENVPKKENSPESVLEVSEGITETASVAEGEDTASLADASKKYGAQAQAMVHTYTEGQDIAKYDSAYSAAYDMGRSGVALSYVFNSDSTEYLTENQKELAYEAGVAAADTAAKKQDVKIKKATNGKTGRRKGTVKGEGVRIEDLKKTFNDPQNKAYKILSTFAEATGIDIVLYKSEANANGEFEGAQGRFNWSDDKLYIDINAGLKSVQSVDELAKYAMLRTFSHEFTHFIEKYNAIWYNEFRKAVFAELTSQGENVHDLIETKMSLNKGMTYEKASREVVAEAMTDILPDSHFVEKLANNHKNVFEKLLAKLKEFLSDLKAYFNTLGHNRSREANALKVQVGDAVHYVESIVELFDKVALGAVENYQKTVAVDEVTENPAKIESTESINADNNADKGSKTAKTDSYEHFTITDNTEFGSLEIAFDGKPSEAIRDVLKANKFRWHGKKGVWYGKGERADIVKALREAYKAEKAQTNTNGLTDDEEAAILAYKSGGSYMLNAKLREGIELDEYEQEIVNNLDKALEKMPTYKGTVYRNIEFDGLGDKEARDEYVAGHIIGEPVSYDAYTSTSTAADGYVLEGDYVVHHIIQSVNGRNLSGHGSDAESEVLFSRNSYYITDKIEYDSNGTPTIYLTEVANEQQETKPQTADERGTEGNVQGDNSGESRSRTRSSSYNKVAVQSVQGENSKGTGEESAHNDLQGVSERNAEGTADKQDDLREVQSEVKAPESVKDVYDNLAEKLRGSYFVKENGLNFGIRGNDKDGYHGFINRRAEASDGRYPVENAFDRIYSSDVFKTYDEVVEDIVSVAKMSKLLKPGDNITNNIEEVKPNVENVDNGSPVQGTVSDRQEDSRVLDEVETSDVQGDVLNPKEEQSLDSVAEDTVQEQSRDYLEDEQYQQRTDTLTDREVLEMASNEIKMSDLSQAELDALTIFQDRLSNLKDLQEKRAEQGRLYKEQQFGTKVDRAKASETLNRMHVLDSQIKKATADVLTVEEKEVLKRVLQKARKVVEVQERQHDQEILKRWQDRRKNADNIKKYRERLHGDVDELTNWIIAPNNKDIVKHVPDVLKNSVIPFLSSINFMSKRSLKGGEITKADERFMDRLKKLNAALNKKIVADEFYSGYYDLPPNFMENLQTFIESTEALVKNNSGELVINQMTSEELKKLSSIVRNLKKLIMQVNRFHNNAMFSHVHEAGDNSIEFMKSLANAGTSTGNISKFLFWQQIRPAYAFERFGKGGEAIYDGLRRGQAKLAFNTKEIASFTKKAYTDKEVKAWEDEIKTFQFGSDTVKIPVSYIMGLYELYKDPDGRRHIDEGGIRVATYTHDGKKISDVGHILTVENINQLLGSLTDRQKEVADSLQKYMASQGAKWGNYVSVARFGEELFTNPNYYPINSDGRHLSATVEEHPSAASLYALLNMSFTKSRKEEANNRVVIYSIFDVFANHMASMAQYNAMALPILDALKWLNYQQVFIDDEGNKTVIANVREQMDRVYGVPEETKPGSGKQGYAETFIVNIIKAFNGTAAQGTPYDSTALKSLHRYNVAQVAYNLRVVLQQPLAITRAGMLISYRSIIKGLKLRPSVIKKNIEEMQRYSGIAAWKSLGFYDVNISRGLTHLIKHDSTFMDKVGDIGMWGAEKADTLTWAAIWSACKEEVTKKQHLTPESEGFFEAVTTLFEDVIYKTQVVDSILTKNEFMRDKGAFARLTGSFMSEPTTNASMLVDAIDKYNLDIKRGMSKRDAWRKNAKMIGRRLYVYGVGAVLLAVVQAAADAFRDDDDYEKWGEKWLEAFVGNIIDELMPLNKLPILADFYDLAKEIASTFGVDTYGNPPQSVYAQWWDSLVDGTHIIADKIHGDDTNYTWYGGIYKLLQAASGMSGMPMSSATREIITAWNNTVGAFAPSLKVKTYEPSELAKIRYAHEDGYLTDEEATELLLEKGLVDTENEAYFTIKGWEAGEEYSRYDALYDAILKGGDISKAMNELTSHGYTEKEVLSQVKSQIGKWYYDEESKVRITKQQAINMLNKYTDMDNEEITATVNKWSSKVVTGIKYDDIDDEFMEGNITSLRAIEMYVRYGSMTKEKAIEKVTVLEFVKRNPECEGISYSAVDGYNTYCEPLGVPANTYYEAWKHKNTLSGEVKESMMAYIHSLRLSKKQKDALYFAFGWKESKLWEAPWH